MRRAIVLFTCLGLIASCMCGCNKNTDNAGNVNTTQQASGIGEEETTAFQNILVPTEHKGIYKYPDTYQSICMPSVLENNNRLVVHYPKNDKEYVEVRDVAGGSLIADAMLDGEQIGIGITDEGFYAYDLSGTVRLLDFRCREIQSYNLKNNNGYNVYFSMDGNYIIYSDNNGAACIYNCQRDEYITLSEVIYINEVICYNTDGFYILDPNGDVFRIDIEGNVINTNKRKNAKYFGDKFIETTHDGYVLSEPMSQSNTLICGDVESEYVLGASADYIVATLNDNTIRIYNTELLKSTEAMNLGEIWMTTMESNGHTTMVRMIEADTFELLTINPEELYFNTELVQSGDYEFDSPYEEFFEEVVPESEEVAQIINEIYETYNVRVFFEVKEDRDNLLLFNRCTPYSGSQLEVVQALKEFMELSPKDIYRQVSENQEVLVMFADRIDDEEGYEDDAVGITFSIGDTMFISVEKCGEAEDMIEIYSHEFIHLLDYSVTAEELTAWDELSPDNAYFGSYIYPYGADKYTYANDGENCYFTDAYARTFREEDRARIGENMYLTYMTGNADIFTSPHLQKKASELCSSYRNNYPCLEEIPEGEWYMDMYLNQ